MMAAEPDSSQAGRSSSLKTAGSPQSSKTTGSPRQQLDETFSCTWCSYKTNYLDPFRLHIEVQHLDMSSLEAGVDKDARTVAGNKVKDCKKENSKDDKKGKGRTEKSPKINWDVEQFYGGSKNSKKKPFLENVGWPESKKDVGKFLQRREKHKTLSAPSLYYSEKNKENCDQTPFRKEVKRFVKAMTTSTNVEDKKESSIVNADQDCLVQVNGLKEETKEARSEETVSSKIVTDVKCSKTEKDASLNQSEDITCRSNNLKVLTVENINARDNVQVSDNSISSSIYRERLDSAKADKSVEQTSLGKTDQPENLYEGGTLVNDLDKELKEFRFKDRKESKTEGNNAENDKNNSTDKSIKSANASDDVNSSSVGDIESVEMMETECVEDLSAKRVEEFNNESVEDISTEKVEEFNNESVEDINTEKFKEFNNKSVEDINTEKFKEFNNESVEDFSTEMAEELCTAAVDERTTTYTSRGEKETTTLGNADVFQLGAGGCKRVREQQQQQQAALTEPGLENTPEGGRERHDEPKRKSPRLGSPSEVIDEETEVPPDDETEADSDSEDIEAGRNLEEATLLELLELTVRKRKLVDNSPKQTLFCSKCSYKTWYASSMEHHQRHGHAPGALHCGACPYSSARPDRLARHYLRWHGGPLRYGCGACRRFAAGSLAEVAGHGLAVHGMRLVGGRAEDEKELVGLVEHDNQVEEEDEEEDEEVEESEEEEDQSEDEEEVELEDEEQDKREDKENDKENVETTELVALKNETSFSMMIDMTSGDDSSSAESLKPDCTGETAGSSDVPNNEAAHGQQGRPATDGACPADDFTSPQLAADVGKETAAEQGVVYSCGECDFETPDRELYRRHVHVDSGHLDNGYVDSGHLDNGHVDRIENVDPVDVKTEKIIGNEL